MSCHGIIKNGNGLTAGDCTLFHFRHICSLINFVWVDVPTLMSPIGLCIILKPQVKWRGNIHTTLVLSSPSAVGKSFNILLFFIFIFDFFFMSCLGKYFCAGSRAFYVTQPWRKRSPMKTKDAPAAGKARFIFHLLFDKTLIWGYF